MKVSNPDPALQKKVDDAQNALAETAKTNPGDLETVKSQLKDLFAAQSAVDVQTGAANKSSKAVDEEQRVVDWLKQSGVDPHVIAGFAKGLNQLQVEGDAKGRKKAGSLADMSSAIDSMNSSSLKQTNDTSGLRSIYKDAHPVANAFKRAGENALIGAVDVVAANLSGGAVGNAVNGPPDLASPVDSTGTPIPKGPHSTPKITS